MPHVSTINEPKIGIVPAPPQSSSDYRHELRRDRESRLREMWNHRKNKAFDVVDISAFQPIDVLDLPDSFFISVIGSRRSGKSFLVNWMLQQFQRSKRAFTHVFLVSPTDSGFDGIPKKFRMKDLTNVNYIVEKQRMIKKHNKKQHKKRDMLRSRVCVVIDDCACMSGDDSLKSSKLLEEMALNGRHVGNDGMEGNGISFFILSQSLTRINRAIRLNQDCFIFNNISSAKERELIMDECFFINTRRDAKRDARNLYETLASSKDFRFICVCNYIQNKRTHADFIRTVDAEKAKDFQFFGTPSDNEDSSDEDELFSNAPPPTTVPQNEVPLTHIQVRHSHTRQLPGGRQFVSGGKVKYRAY